MRYNNDCSISFYHNTLPVSGEEGGCKCVQVIVAMQTRCYKADLGKRCKYKESLGRRYLNEGRTSTRLFSLLINPSATTELTLSLGVADDVVIGNSLPVKATLTNMAAGSVQCKVLLTGQASAHPGDHGRVLRCSLNQSLVLEAGQGGSVG